MIIRGYKRKGEKETNRKEEGKGESGSKVCSFEIKKLEI